MYDFLVKNFCKAVLGVFNSFKKNILINTYCCIKKLDQMAKKANPFLKSICFLFTTIFKNLTKSVLRQKLNIYPQNFCLYRCIHSWKSRDLTLLFPTLPTSASHLQLVSWVEVLSRVVFFGFLNILIIVLFMSV